MQHFSRHSSPLLAAVSSSESSLEAPEISNSCMCGYIAWLEEQKYTDFVS